MSFEHLAAIRKLTLPSASKAVLTWAAWHACRACGIAFAGTETLAMETCLGNATVRRALNDLRQRRMIVVVGYLQGGRGRATEYLVIPHLVPMPAGVCQVCHKDTSRSETRSQRAGIAGETRSPRAGLAPADTETRSQRAGIGSKSGSRQMSNPLTESTNPLTVSDQGSVEPELSDTPGGPRALRSAGQAVPVLQGETSPDPLFEAAMRRLTESGN